MQKRITNFQTSNRIDGWASILFFIGIVAAVLGVVVLITDGLAEGAPLLLGGIVIMAAGRALSGFAAIVRKTLNDLVEDGDDKYLHHIHEDDEVK